MRSSIVDATNNQELSLFDALVLINNSEWATEGFITAKLVDTCRKEAKSQVDKTTMLLLS